VRFVWRDTSSVPDAGRIDGTGTGLIGSGSFD
jgi:hypothetical protein